MLRACMLAVLMASSFAAAEDKKVDNPIYVTWSKNKPGTKVTAKSTSTEGGKTTEQTIVSTLLEVSDTKCVVETEVTEKDAGGGETKAPATKRDVPKQLDETPSGLDPKTGKPKGTFEEGSDKVKIGGTDFECKWYKFKRTAEGIGDIEGQVWMCDDMPGRTVKLTTKSKTGERTVQISEVVIKK